MSSLFQRRSPVNEDEVVLLVLRASSVCKHGSQLSPSKVGLGPAPCTVLMPGHISALPHRQWQCLGQRLAQDSNGAASDHALTADVKGISCDGTTHLNSSVYSVGTRDKSQARPEACETANWRRQAAHSCRQVRCCGMQPRNQWLVLAVLFTCAPGCGGACGRLWYGASVWIVYA